jgi:hypothetical protein
MREHPDHHDAELLLRLYELRREEKLRLARDWFFQEFYPDSFENVMKQLAPGSKENTYYRMVVSYWDMAASIVNHGLIHEDFFFENAGEIWAIWMKVAPLLPRLRERFRDPHAYENLDRAARKYEAWMEKRSPGALAVRRELLQALAPKK